MINYIEMIEKSQDDYYEIRDFLRTQLALPRHLSEQELAAFIKIAWGSEWARHVSDLIADVQDLLQYEEMHGLSTEP